MEKQLLPTMKKQSYIIHETTLHAIVLPCSLMQASSPTDTSIDDLDVENDDDYDEEGRSRQTTHKDVWD